MKITEITVKSRHDFFNQVDRMINHGWRVVVRKSSNRNAWMTNGRMTFNVKWMPPVDYSVA